MQDRIIDIESYAKTEKVPPHGCRYRIRVDREKYVVRVECMTGREILELAGKKPADCYRLYQRVRGEKIEVGYDEKVDFTKPGVERFITLPLEIKDGETLRKTFELSEEDIVDLDNLGVNWETIRDNGNWVIIRDYPVCSGYNVDNVDVALKIEAGYPGVQIDMAYFNPGLARKDGKPIDALAGHNLDGKNWQRWSRHRTPQNPWRPGIDNISTHLLAISDWFQRELNK
ncbi:MAG: multiubiquitin domain-containing protein [Calditrichia bacterium]